MRHWFFITTLLVFLIPCGCAKKEQAVIRIGDIDISKEEFLQAYQTSAASDQERPDLKIFLDQYISKKVILREAERLGLDRDRQFLTDIQQYWEQGLLKLMLSKENKELSSITLVSDQEIENYYAQNKETFFAGKEFPEVRSQIQEFLNREKQKAALQQWVEDLKQKTKIEIDYPSLGIK